MNCQDFEIYGSAYIDDALSEEEKIEFENHINECNCCNIKLKNLKIVIESMNDIEEIELPINFSTELKSKLEKEKPNNIKNIIFNYKKMLSVIVAGIFVFIASISLINNFSTYINKNNFYSQIDRTADDTGPITFNIASEKSTESIENGQSEDIKQPRTMSINNTAENKELASEEKNKEISKDNYKIAASEETEDSLENKDINTTESSNYKSNKLLALVSILIGAVGILVYSKFKK